MSLLSDRASRIAERKNSGVTVGDEPLIIDLQPPNVGFHWVAYQLCVVGVLTTRQPVANPIPTFGLYMVPNNAVQESLADAQNATQGWNPTARLGIALPYTLNITRTGAGGVWLFTLTAQIFAECILPAGWMFRFIGSCVPGTATPGPGANSQAAFSAHVIEESNACPLSPMNV